MAHTKNLGEDSGKVNKDALLFDHVESIAADLLKEHPKEQQHQQQSFVIHQSGCQGVTNFQGDFVGGTYGYSPPPAIGCTPTHLQSDSESEEKKNPP
eukprot:scaffold38044_cov176-Amphora_coffeaeformis.AAC.2